MNLSLFRSLRFKMPLLVLMGIVPLILIAIFYANDRATKIVLSEAETNLKLRANTLTQDINRWNEMNELALKSLSRQESIRSGIAALQKPALIEIVDTYQHLYRALTVNIDGWTVARSDNRKSQYRGDRDYFKKALTGEDKIFYQALISRTTDRPALCMSTAIKPKQLTVIGVAVICANLEKITNQIGQMKFGQTGYAFLINNEGRVLAHPNTKYVSGKYLKNLSSYPPVANFLQGNLGKQFFKDEAGIDWIYHTNSLDNDWGIVVLQEKSEFLQGEKELERLAFLVAAVAVISASAITFFLANYLIGPIAKLTNNAIALANGQWHRTVEITSKDELGILARSFDRMAIELKSLFENLEGRIEQRTLELKSSQESAEKAKESAVAANRAKDRFIANISHELISPLNSILGYTKIIKKDKSLSYSHSKKLQVIEKNGIHLLTLIEDILDFSKNQLNQIELHPSELELSDFLNEVIDLVAPLAQRKELKLIKRLQDLPLGVIVDEKRLRQVLINLLTNAIKFTDSGQISLQVTAIEPIATKDSLPQQKLRFEVQDTGIGMTASDREKIFQPFEQLGDIRSRSKGTGLGLSISRQLVKLMGGNLEVDSKLNVGSTFWFELSLPVLEADRDVLAATKGQIIGYQGPRLKILIADDRPENRHVLVEILEPIGFSIMTVNNGEKMLELANSFEPDLILLDLFMPVKTGFASVKEIRQIPKFQDLPIFVITASSITPEMSDHLNCQEILNKPVEREKLLLNLEKHFNLKWIYQGSKPQDLDRCS
ncbi:MAG: ATP-binding protein [Prochloraceae cyanobacterium]|nr:ATP-binding protein [Prochloraceae cyanobacterium]